MSNIDWSAIGDFFNGAISIASEIIKILSAAGVF